MGKIAIWDELNISYGSSGSPWQKCPTKDEIMATNRLEITRDVYYTSTQCVQLNHIKRITPTSNTIVFAREGNNMILWDSTCELTSNITAHITYTFRNEHTDEDEHTDYLDFILSTGDRYGTFYIDFGITSLDGVEITPTSDYRYNYKIIIKN